MVAALQPRPLISQPGSQLPTHPMASQRRPARATHLRVIEGGAGRASVEPMVLAILAVVTVVALLVGLRIVQGGPPASTWDELAGTSSAVLAPTSGPASAATLSFVAAEGDTWWAIAERVAPAADTTEVVRVLIEANGGPRLDVGQIVIVPDSVTLGDGLAT